MPTTQAFTRTLGPHSTASVWVRLSRPALAAPYAPVPGDGRRPLRLQMLTIDPPSAWSCILSLEYCETISAPMRLSSMILRLNFGLDSAVSTYGEPPALLTTTSILPCSSTMESTNDLTASSSRTSHEWNSYGKPSTGRRAQVITVAPCPAKTELMPTPTPRTPPVTRTTRPASPRLIPSAASAEVTVLAYQASACLGSQPHCSRGSAHCPSHPPPSNRTSSRSPSTTRPSTPSRRAGGSSWPTRSPPPAPIPIPTRRSCEPKAGASTRVLTSRRCNERRDSPPSSTPTAAASPPSARYTNAPCR